MVTDSIQYSCILTPEMRQSKMLILSTNVDQEPLETELSIAVCRPIGDKWQSKTLFQAGFFYPRNDFDCRLPGVILKTVGLVQVVHVYTSISRK